MGINRGFRDAVAKEVMIENMVKPLLSAHGVGAIFSNYYMDFGKKINSLSRKHAGEVLWREVCMQYEKWKKRGLAATVLEEIIARFGLQPCIVPPVPPITFSYDFSDGAGVNKWCWKGANPSLPPAPKNIGGVELTPAEYLIKGADDDFGAEMIYFGLTKQYAYMLMRFDITEDRAKITELTLTEKVLSGTSGVLLFVWNVSTGVWEFVAGGPSFIKVTLTKTYTANITDYVDSGGQVWMLVMSGAIVAAPAHWLSALRNYYAKVSGVWQP